jgi:hypothetical protein
MTGSPTLGLAGRQMKWQNSTFFTGALSCACKQKDSEVSHADFAQVLHDITGLCTAQARCSACGRPVLGVHVAHQKVHDRPF